MFPKGPRFEPQKIPNVPGPGAYDIAAESQLDDYKRGAFIEKANRFSKDKESQVPGPGTGPKRTLKSCTSDFKNANSQTLGDRYAILQRKVDDLEKVHNEGKKAHQADTDRLKAELSRCQKANAEQTERAEKQKKQIDTLESRIQDLKKVAALDQAELKDLRVKLRMSEHEKTQLVGKQGEAAEMKKSLQSLETKRREELRERDRRIAELEKVLNLEKKRKEAAEGKLQDIKGRGDDELQAARATAQKLENAVATSNAETMKAREALSTLQEAKSGKEEELLIQLEHHRNLVGQVAEEYGRLVRGTVSLTSHMQLRNENATLTIQISRLERKLANTMAQVDELAFLIRQTNEQKTVLSQRLRDVELEAAFYQEAWLEFTPLPVDHDRGSLLDLLERVERNHRESQEEVHSLDTRMAQLCSEFYKLTGEQLLLDHILVDKQFKCEQRISNQYSTSLKSAVATQESIAAQLESVREEKNTLDGQLKAATELADSLKSESESLVRRATEAEEKMAETAVRSEAAMKKDRDAVRRLTDTVQKSRMAEDALRAEIEQLTIELTEAQRYEDAYHQLSEEVGSLVARNQLAEEEAQKLNRFNAEILGHNNPAQRIMYVDRIRRELAETKHKLVMLTREQEATVAINDDLQHELDMYKSVMVPTGNKPRTAITRITRQPLVNLARDLNASGAHSLPVSVAKPSDALGNNSAQGIENLPDDMTIDEIL